MKEGQEELKLDNLKNTYIKNAESITYEAEKIHNHLVPEKKGKSSENNLHKMAKI